MRLICWSIKQSLSYRTIWIPRALNWWHYVTLIFVLKIHQYLYICSKHTRVHTYVFAINFCRTDSPPLYFVGQLTVLWQRRDKRKWEGLLASFTQSVFLERFLWSGEVLHHVFLFTALISGSYAVTLYGHGGRCDIFVRRGWIFNIRKRVNLAASKQNGAGSLKSKTNGHISMLAMASGFNVATR